MEAVITAAIIMTGLGVVFAVILATADHFLKVEEDPRLEKVENLLPGNNCGACGEPGCSAFAAKLIGGVAAPSCGCTVNTAGNTGGVAPSGCTVNSAGNTALIAELLGIDAGSREKQVARLKCAGGEGLANELASYEGISSCRAAVLVDGGGRSCTYGCLGFGDCRDVCTFDAIMMNWEALPQVNPDLCTACG
ncbi:MAG: (Fe-S)-binding protein, partial [Acidobacteriota bacterium]